MLKSLQKNVTNIWGQQGEAWLLKLPEYIELLANYWSLTHINPVNNMSYNYVALGVQKNHRPVVLKISCDPKLILKEYHALKHFAGHGAVKMLDMNVEYNALLLEQAIPGCSLKYYNLSNINDRIDIYARVVNTLAACSLPSDYSVHARMWCEAIDRITDSRIKQPICEKARVLRSTILDSAPSEYLCHGDLHLDNIIQHDVNWLAIDPKGVIGEIAFEAAAFDLTAHAKTMEYIKKLSVALQLDFNRLLIWVFLRAVISAQWFIEDGGDPSEKIELIEHIYPKL